MKYYAIKIGNNVEDEIVSNWKECEKLVIGYPAIYKSFSDKKEAQKWLKNFENKEIESRLKQGEYYRIRKLKEKLGINYTFKIPYLIKRIIIYSKNYSYEDFCCALELEIESRKISIKNAEKLKKSYKNIFKNNV